MEKKYKKNSPRLSVKFIDTKTNKQLFELSEGINWMNVGEFFSDKYVDDLLKQTIKDTNLLPSDICVIVVTYYKLT